MALIKSFFLYIKSIHFSSPDGTALATASADGQVKFFQVYMHGTENPRCLHQWKPHEGQPVSSLFFLDNHKVLFSDKLIFENRCLYYKVLMILKIWIDYCEDPARNGERLNFSTHFS